MLPTNPEAFLYMILFYLMVVVALLALAAWYAVGKQADKAIASRRAAEKHAVEETARADQAEAELALLRERHGGDVDRHYDGTLWGRNRPEPAPTLVMFAANGAPLNIGNMS